MIKAIILSQAMLLGGQAYAYYQADGSFECEGHATTLTLSETEGTYRGATEESLIFIDSDEGTPFVGWQGAFGAIRSYQMETVSSRQTVTIEIRQNETKDGRNAGDLGYYRAIVHFAGTPIESMDCERTN